MSLPLLALGDNIFEIEPLNFQEIERTTVAKWPAVPRFGTRPARQFTGYGEHKVTIRGLLFPEAIGGREEYEAVRATQAAARPVSLIGFASSTKGRVFGLVVILSVSDTQDHIGPDGGGRRLSFDIECAPYGGGVGGFGGFF